MLTEFKAMATWCWVEFPGKELGVTLLQLHWTCCKTNTEHCFCFTPLLAKVKTGSVSVQSLSLFWLFVIPWTAARQASLSITNSWSLLKLVSIELVMPSNHLILCCPLLLLSIFPSIRIFSNESVFLIRWPKYWSFSFSISNSNECSGLISFRIDWVDLLVVQGTLRKVFSSTTVRRHQFFST